MCGLRVRGYVAARIALVACPCHLVVTLPLLLLIFAIAGVVISADGRALVTVVPWAALAVGVVLVGLGVWLLAGRSLHLNIVTPQWDVRERSPKAMFLFGLGYAIASLSCTVPIFLAVSCKNTLHPSLLSSSRRYICIMGANRNPQIHVDINLSCDACVEEMQACAVKGIDLAQLKDSSPTLWEHLQVCPTCAETYLELTRAIQAISAEEVPCELCTGQMEAAAEQGLSHAEARKVFPETWKHVETCPVCAPRYAELLHLIHEEGHLEAHAEERAIRRTVTIVASLAVVLISLLTLGVLRWMRTGEQAIVSQIYQQMGPAIVRIAAVGRTGSGMIFDHEGHILTNNHVVEGADKISVRLADGTTVDARLVGQDLATDLAVIQIDVAGHPIGVVRFGDSGSLKIGELAIVIGNPFDLERSLSVGYISALNRILSTRDPYGAQIYGGIQTDAAINPGNSGGPLFNSDGEVIGVTTSIVPGPSGGSVGVGFAVPINTARQVIDEILTRGYVSRPYLGVAGRSLMTFEATRLGLPVDHGLVVSQVDPGSPADKIGLFAGTQSAMSVVRGESIGDVILALDGRPVESLSGLWRLLQEHDVGDEVVLTVLRTGQELELTAELQEQPRPDQHTP